MKNNDKNKEEYVKGTVNHDDQTKEEPETNPENPEGTPAEEKETKARKPKKEQFRKPKDPNYWHIRKPYFLKRVGTKIVVIVGGVTLVFAGIGAFLLFLKKGADANKKANNTETATDGQTETEAVEADDTGEVKDDGMDQIYNMVMNGDWGDGTLANETIDSTSVTE